VTAEYQRETGGVKEIVSLVVAPRITPDERYVLLLPDLQMHLDPRQPHPPLLLVDTRPTEAWEEGHLPGSVPLPQTRLFATARPPAEVTGYRVVFTGAGEWDETPHRMLRQALAHGFSDVRVFSPGAAGWARERLPLQITANGLRRQMSAGRHLRVVDLRSPKEVAQGRIPESVVPAGEMITREELLLADPNYPLVLYGRDEADPAPDREARRAYEWDYQSESNSAMPVRILAGGYAAWRAAGLPSAGDVPAPLVAYQPKPGSGEVTLKEFREVWQERDGQRLILNVRHEGSRTFPWEVLLPLEQLPERLQELPRDREILLYCYLGRRATVAYQILYNNGYRPRLLRRECIVDQDGVIRP
jgi:rhodanese-related sulfurtransferase